jgi:YndJ-like protein
LPGGPRWKLIAALWIVARQLGLASAMAYVGFRATSQMARGLLIIASGSVIVAMVLAAVWAVGEYPLQPMVDLYRMERIHGVLNALGFSACGLLGWRAV